MDKIKGGNMKHTPAPWELKEKTNNGISIYAKVDIGKEDMSGGQLQPIYEVSIEPSLEIIEDGSVRAMLVYESWRGFASINFKEMQLANARLIASAPELLEALKGLLSCNLHENLTGGYQFHIENAEEIVAKIEKEKNNA